MNIRSIDINYIEAEIKLAVDNHLSEQQKVSALFNNKYATEINQSINELFSYDVIIKNMKYKLYKNAQLNRNLPDLLK
jgi:hypothetical protein